MKRSALVQHLRIAVELARVGIVRKSQFKVEFWCQVTMDLLWYVSHVAVFEVLFLHAPDIAGWNREQFRVLMGFLFVSDAFMMIWLGQMWRLGRDLKDGKLDAYRVRPASTLFLYGFQQFSLEGCVNMSMALVYLIYGASIALGGLSSSALLSIAAGVALCCWVRVVIVTLFSTLEFWLLGSDAGRFISELFHAAGDRPVDIFGARMRTFLLFIVPVGALTQIPASIVLSRYSLLEGVLASLWLAAFGLLVFAAWNRGFRRYESALG